MHEENAQPTPPKQWLRRPERPTPNVKLGGRKAFAAVTTDEVARAQRHCYRFFAGATPATTILDKAFEGEL